MAPLFLLLLLVSFPFTQLRVPPAVSAAVCRRPDDVPPGDAPATVSVRDDTDRPGHDDRPAPRVPEALADLLDAVNVMQTTYFEVFSGTWPTAIDWTAAVLGTHVSATLTTLVSSFSTSIATTCSDLMWWQNVIDRYFSHTSIFYFGENAFAVRNQAYDDMLWVVLGWLENIKFMEIYSLQHWAALGHTREEQSGVGNWHGLQFSKAAAHRARIFYELASDGWDTDLCGGGMNWNPRLTPYKNAITNELFIAASISMYLYFPGDNITSPYFAENETHLTLRSGLHKPHDPLHLENAIRGYKWLQRSRMQHPVSGLYQDGFHIQGWRRYRNGTIDPGTRQCDEINTMVYTYNQGVLLTAQRALWVATGARSYLDDGHALIDSVIRATGWPDRDHTWRGLGRAGVLEEFCDHAGQCSQDGQTFKGIFFHHLSEFCRPLWDPEREFMSRHHDRSLDDPVYRYHMTRCAAYGPWIAHNADAARRTRDDDGKFGMWWGPQFPQGPGADDLSQEMRLAPDAVDYRNCNNTAFGISPDPSWADDAKTTRFGPGQGTSQLPMQAGTWRDVNDRGRGRTVETQSGGLAVLRAHWQWQALLPAHG